MPQSFIIFLQNQNWSVIVDFRAIFRFFSILRFTISRARFWESKFQIDQTRLVCPKIEPTSFSSLVSKLVFSTQLNKMLPSEKGFGHYKCVFREFFFGCWGHFDAKNSFFEYFRWFLMIFDDFTRSQLFGSVSRACAGAQESKKIEIAKNELKHPQTIIECHTKVFKVRLSDLGCHMSQSIFLDFRGFWGVFGGNM